MARSSLENKLLKQFSDWELRGRGWSMYPEAVELEPPFQPFHGHFAEWKGIEDDGRKPTFFSSILSKIGRTVSPGENHDNAPDEDEGLIPEFFSRQSVVEFRLSLPEEFDIPAPVFEQFLSSLSLCQDPIAYELLGADGSLAVQFSVSECDASLIARQLTAHFPEIIATRQGDSLEKVWECAEDETLIVEFGLKNEFMLPLACPKADLFVSLTGILGQLNADETALYQILFHPVQNPWSESIINSVTHANGEPFFLNFPELTKAAEKKIASPLYAAVVRILISASEYARAVELARNISGCLSIFRSGAGNELIPLSNDEYAFEDHVVDTLLRQSRRAGMLINREELLGFIHLPSSAVRLPTLSRQTDKTKAAPAIARQSGLLLGTNRHAGNTSEVRISAEQRTRHCHIIGASGTGKSTLLLNLISQDIKNGGGVAVLDPHGDLIDRISGEIPEHRIKDVVLIDPSDETHAVAFNILSAHTELEKNLLASDLISVFERLSRSWGDQMNSVLQNAILAFLESDQRGTLADLRRFLIEPVFRSQFLKTVKDKEIVYYWQKSFPHLAGNKSIGSIITRLDTFLAQKPIRHMVSQQENKLDVADIMDTGKIFLAKLPEGLLGRENSQLLGTLLVSKFQQIAMSRQGQQATSRRDFWLYIDEFANFITPSMAEILSGARKYRIGLTLAHQELHQLQKSADVASAVMSHPYTRIVFRVGDDDAKKLADGFSYFESKDVRNLETGHAICRVERSDFDFNLSVLPPTHPDEAESSKRRHEVIETSRKKYAKERVEIEKDQEEPQSEKQTGNQPLATETKGAGKSESREQSTSRSKATQPPIPTATETKADLHPPLSEILTSQRKCESKETPKQPTQGRGGAAHQALQKRIKDEADLLGFRAILEKPVLDGRANFDVWLERDGQSIACEVSFTNTVHNEASKIIKCIKAGIPKVAMICDDEEKLQKIEAMISSGLDTEFKSIVQYFSPDQFIAYLKALPSEAPPGTTVKRRGYKIKKIISDLSIEKQKERDAATIRAIADSMRKK